MRLPGIHQAQGPTGPWRGSDFAGSRLPALRFPGSTEFRWSLNTSDGYQNFDVTGPFACDDGDVLTEWALDGRGIINKPTFEIQHHLDSGALIPVCQKSPPPNTQLAVLYPHRKNQDPKSRFFIDFMSDTLKAALA